MRHFAHRTSLVSLLISICATASVGTAVSPVAAQHQALLPQTQKGASASTLAHKAQAKQHFERGLALFNAGNAVGALAEFQQAYSHVPNPLVLFNIGLTYASLGLPVQATSSLKGVLTNPGALRPSVLNRAQEVLIEQEKRIGTVTFTANTQAGLVVDGQAVGTTPLPSPLALNSGPHRVTAEAPGHAPLLLDIVIMGGQKRAIHLTLQALAHGPKALSSTATSAPPGRVQPIAAPPGRLGRPALPASLPRVEAGATAEHSPTSFEETSSARPTGWAILGGGIAVLAAGGVVTALSEDESSLRLAGRVGVGVGAAAIVGGALIVLLAKSGDRLAQLSSPTHFNAQIHPKGGTLFVHGLF